MGAALSVRKAALRVPTLVHTLALMDLREEIRAAARPLRHEADLDPLLERIGGARFVLLGEASHGTSEYYAWRARITMRLVREAGFSFVGVEGDWPDCFRVHRWIGGQEPGSAEDVLRAFERWPTWMWANREVAALVRWLGEQRGGGRAGFFGLDVYSLRESMAAVLAYLERVDPPAAQEAREAYACFERFGGDPHDYARMMRWVVGSCEADVVRTLARLRARAPIYRERHDGDALFDAEQNALVARGAELYYRSVIRGGSQSWNVRDHHMVATLMRLARHHGPSSRGIVWAHNTHVGDARATSMRDAGMVNVGQLVREQAGDEGVFIVGFASHRGSVIAAREWGAPMEEMAVPPAREGSWEDVLHESCGGDRLIFTADLRSEEAALARGHRAIGVVYDPALESFGNYVPTVLPARYDALIHLDETRALEPLHVPERPVPEPPETYPSGF